MVNRNTASIITVVLICYEMFKVFNQSKTLFYSEKNEDSIDIHIFSLNNKDKRKLIACVNSMKVVCLHQVRDAKLNKIEIDQLIYFS